METMNQDHKPRSRTRMIDKGIKATKPGTITMKPFSKNEKKSGSCLR